MRTAHHDPGCHFSLSEIGKLDRLVALFQLASFQPEEAGPVAWEALKGLLADEPLRTAVPSLAPLADVLADGVVCALARFATSSCDLESTHPSSTTHMLLPLACAGASMMQLRFDCRSRLCHGSRIAIYLDAACTEQVMSSDGEDLSTLNTFWVPSDRVWVHYKCAQGRDRAWGFKLRATAVSWRARNEQAALELPPRNTWDVMQLLADVAPLALSRPRVCANLLRYLRCAKAPYRERVCHVLSQVLPNISSLRDGGFDWTPFRSLESQIEWHEELYERHRAPPLLPCSTQATIGLLVDLRDRMKVRRPYPCCPLLRTSSQIATLLPRIRWSAFPCGRPRCHTWKRWRSFRHFPGGCFCPRHVMNRRRVLRCTMWLVLPGS